MFIRFFLVLIDFVVLIMRLRGDVIEIVCYKLISDNCF